MPGRPATTSSRRSGSTRIRENSLRQTQLLIDLADAAGFEVVSPRESARRGGSVVVRVPEFPAVHAELEARGILCDFRPDAGIRLGPHFFSADDELRFAIEQIAEIVETGAYEPHLHLGARRGSLTIRPLQRALRRGSDSAGLKRSSSTRDTLSRVVALVARVGRLVQAAPNAGGRGRRSKGRSRSGRSCAGYRIEELIGRGGMGEVYRARHDRLERNVALKILSPRYAEDERFATGCCASPGWPPASTTRTSSPSTTPARRTDASSSRCATSREPTSARCCGAKASLDPARAVDIAAQVADALDAAHERGLVHRDVKPSNVLIDERGHCYLADFGLTQSASDAGPFDGQPARDDRLRLARADPGRPDRRARRRVRTRLLLYECLTGSFRTRGRRTSRRSTRTWTRSRSRRASSDPACPLRSTRCSRAPSRRTATTARGAADCSSRRHGSRSASALARARGSGGSPSARWCSLSQRSPRSPARWRLRGGGGVAASGGVLARIDPASNAVVAGYPLSAYPGSVTASDDRVWVGDFRDGSLWRLDPASGDLERFTTTGEPRDLATTGGDVYVASDGETLLDGTIARYDSVTGQREAGVKLLACSIAAAEGVVWVAGCPFIQRLSTDSGRLRVVREVEMPWREPRSAETDRSAFRDMAIGEGALWVLSDPVGPPCLQGRPAHGRDPRRDGAAVRAAVDRGRRGRCLDHAGRSTTSSRRIDPATSACDRHARRAERGHRRRSGLRRSLGGERARRLGHRASIPARSSSWRRSTSRACQRDRRGVPAVCG